MSESPESTGPDHGAARRFFDEFDSPFVSFDGDVIAQRYAEPYMACRADGSCEVFADASATGRYFDAIVGRYHEMGVRSCSHRDLDVVDGGGRHIVATVTWDLLDAGGAVVISWRESYLLVTIAGRLVVRTSVDHAA